MFIEVQFNQSVNLFILNPCRTDDVELNPGPGLTTDEKLEQILQTLKHQSKTLSDIKRDQRAVQKEENGAAIKHIEDRLAQLESSFSKLDDTQRTVSRLNEKVTVLSRKVDDMENRQRRNNLIIIGLPEQDNETQADLSKLMQDKIFSVIGTSPRSIERMHRLGKKQSKARPVIFPLYDFKEKQEIMPQAERYERFDKR